MSAEALLASFLQQTNSETELNTEYFSCPEFEEVPASIASHEIKTGMATSKNGEQEKPWFSLNLKWSIDSEVAREAVHRDEVLVNGRPIFLTVSPDNTLDPVNNQPLARLLKMFEIDMAGMTNAEIFACLNGKQATVRVVHRALTNKSGEALLDEKGEPRFAPEVTGYAPL